MEGEGKGKAGGRNSEREGRLVGGLEVQVILSRSLLLLIRSLLLLSRSLLLLSRSLLLLGRSFFAP